MSSLLSTPPRARGFEEDTIEIADPTHSVASVVSGLPPRAVLVDFGGVLTTSVFESFATCSAELGGDPGLITRLLAEDAESSRLLVEHECGRLDDAGFETGFALRLRAHGVAVLPVDGQGLIRHMQAALRPDAAMLDGIARLRDAGVQVALVSNSLGSWCYDGYDLGAIADVVVLSGELGVRKPSRRIYAAACERLGVEPARCVLVDDIERNLAGAARIGIRGVLHVRAHETLAALRAWFTDRFEWS